MPRTQGTVIPSLLGRVSLGTTCMHIRELPAALGAQPSVTATLARDAEQADDDRSLVPSRAGRVARTADRPARHLPATRARVAASTQAAIWRVAELPDDAGAPDERANVPGICRGRAARRPARRCARHEARRTASDGTTGKRGNALERGAEVSGRAEVSGGARDASGARASAARGTMSGSARRGDGGRRAGDDEREPASAEATSTSTTPKFGLLAAPFSKLRPGIDHTLPSSIASGPHPCFSYHVLKGLSYGLDGDDKFPGLSCVSPAEYSLNWLSSPPEVLNS
ncbi:hypothetical protein EV714DRAFT_275960 [Schizophyllum commune]